MGKKIAVRLRNYYQQQLIEAGCDEAGRGCLAGPVFAASVILNPKKPIKGLNDSKLLTANARYKLKKEIEKKALAWSVAMVSNTEIDKINIFKASMKAMHLAIDGLKTAPGFLLIDGHLFIKYKEVPHACIIKGDSKYKCIAAASILAKTYRDDFMDKIHMEHNYYKWNTNKGYATSFHRQAIKEFGISPYHRKSFSLMDQQLKLEFEDL